jgi:hypothetical protein
VRVRVSVRGARVSGGPHSLGFHQRGVFGGSKAVLWQNPNSGFETRIRVLKLEFGFSKTQF